MIIFIIINWIIESQRSLKITKDQQRGLKITMSLPMGLYKLVMYDRWDDEWNGDGDYSYWDIVKVYFYQTFDMGRYICSPDGLFKHLMKDKDASSYYISDCDQADGTITIASHYFRWYDLNACYTGRPWDMAHEEGISGWDWDIMY